MQLERDGLNSCPFCGSNAFVTITSGVMMVFVECNVCKSRGPLVNASIILIGDAVAKAVADWNTRK